jgi:hypothetical protein
MDWWTKNRHGFWCNFCGALLSPAHHFDIQNEWDHYENSLANKNCPECGAPDEFDPEAF